MRTSLVLTIIGPDRPGLVEAVSRTVAEHAGNWEESRMAQLAGKFAGILRVSVASDSAPALSRALHALESEGLHVIVEPSAQAQSRAPGLQQLRLEVVGNDREGIVRELSQALAARKVNVDELHTQCEPAAMTGEPLFRANAELSAPRGVAIEELRKALEGIGDDLMVDVSLVAVADDPRR
jgi:glycine cleavage system regulatory protein